MPETLASAILRRKAAKMNKDAVGTGKRFVAPSDLKRESAWVEYVSTASGYSGRARLAVLKLT
jgi:hypothetical protein